jgi:hypothetical protein
VYTRLIRVILLVFALACAMVAEDTWKGVNRIVAVGDVHGDLPQLISVLRAAGVIDAANKWSGGKTHLVQTGDVLDRGPDSRKLIELFMTLEKQARSAGGAVHCLIGNHEAMNLYGDLRYVSAPDYAQYQNDESAALRDKGYQQHLEDLKHSPQTAELVPDDAYRKKWESTHPLGFFERMAYFAADGVYGKWIRGHEAIIKVNDMVFLHGGISEKFASLSIRKINEQITKELRDFSKLEGGMAMDDQGPLWYRGLADGDEKQLDDLVSAALERMGARQIVIGHTPTKGMVLPRFNGKVLLIDVGLSQVYGAHPACLVIEGGKEYTMHRGTRVPLPEMPAGLTQYLSQIRALDMRPQ